MVEIREENSTSGESTSHGNENAQSSNTYGQAQTSVMNFINANKLDTIIFVFRMLTIFFSIQYMIPYSDQEFSRSVYIKAFIACGGSNIFRLYQRLSVNGFGSINQQFLMRLMSEDSLHYLLYCMTFPMSTPVTMALIPIVVISFYNSVNYFNRLSSSTGIISGFAQKLVAFRTQNSANMLSLAACAEIFNFPIFFALIFTGKCNIFFPVLYFRFLTFRYASQRNPYTRIVFASMKQQLLTITSHPSCPRIIQTYILKAINLIERFAPPVA